MKKNGFHILFTYFIGCCMLFTSAGALAEGGGGGGSGIELPLESCVDLAYMDTTVSAEAVACDDPLISSLGTPTATLGNFPPTESGALCTVYEYVAYPSSVGALSIPVRTEVDGNVLNIGIYAAADLVLHEAGPGDTATYLKGDIQHRVAEASLDVNNGMTIVVAHNLPSEEMLVRLKTSGGGNKSNYCTTQAPVSSVVNLEVPPPPLFYENTLKVEERVVKNGKCNIRIKGTCDNATVEGWKCTAEGKDFVDGGGSPGLLCQQDVDDPYTTVTGTGATYCEPKYVDNLQLSATSGGNPLFTENYYDGEEQCYNENPITNAGEQSFSCFWWASPPFCF